MTSTAEIRNGVCLIVLDGEFDRTNVGELVALAKGCLGRARSIVLDFGAVTFVDAAMLSFLGDVLDGLPAKGWLGVARPAPYIERLFPIAGLSNQPKFRLFRTLEEALEVIDRT